ncbi:MAG: hypothetical protein ACHQF2_05075, partial [Flavobacteriales bacterium]
IYGWKRDGSDALDTITHQKYYYDKTGKFKYYTEKDFESGVTVKKYKKHTITRKQVENIPRLDSIVYKNAQVYSHVVDTIWRPCLSVYAGKHKLVYSYLDNGLIHSVKIIPLTIAGRKDEWFFIYEFFE